MANYLVCWPEWWRRWALIIPRRVWSNLGVRNLQTGRRIDPAAAYNICVGRCQLASVPLGVGVDLDGHSAECTQSKVVRHWIGMAAVGLLLCLMTNVTTAEDW